MSLSAGTPFEVDVNGQAAMSITNLSSTQSILAYRDVVDDDFEVRIIENDETVGTATTIETSPVGGNEQIAVARLTDTKAIVVWGTGISDTIAAVLTTSGTTITKNAESGILAGSDGGPIAAIALSSTDIVVASGDNVIYLTVSGTTITEEDSAFYEASTDNIFLTSLSSTKAILAYTAGANVLKAKVITATAGAISDGAAQNIEGGDDGPSNSVGAISLAPIDSASVFCVYINSTESNLKAVVLAVSGDTITPNTPVEIVSGAVEYTAIADFTTSEFAVFYDDQMVQVSRSGAALTAGSASAFTSDAGATINKGSAFSATLGIVAYQSTAKAVIITLSTVGAAGEYDPAPMRRPADIDADGDNIYIAAINSLGNPVLIKIATALDADGSLVFDPGSGSDIGVQCGTFDAGVIWIAGAFDGTNVVEKSEDSGSSFTVKDPATFGAIEAFIVGPDSDTRILVSDVGNDDIQETIDDGDNWTQHNASVGFDINAIARLPQNVQESVFGNDSSVTNNLNYSVNSGDDMEDIGAAAFEEDVTSLAVG
jgi:hypothetical protein